MKAYELLEKPGSWTTDTLARTIDDIPTDPNSEEACKWCAYGAICKCYSQIESNKRMNIRILEEKVGSSIGLWNDTHTHSVVWRTLKELNI